MKLLWWFGMVLVLFSCSEESDTPGIPHQTTPYALQIPEHFNPPPIPASNPLTEEGVKLGRHLFYEPMLSRDFSISCASCHPQNKSFSDPNQFSIGVDNQSGTRNSMALINLAYGNRMFWDGRAFSLEEQLLEPVPNPIEMDLSWPEAVARLQADQTYREMFYDAFGTYSIDSTHVAKALAQFIRTLISGNSKFDKFIRGEAQLSLLELRGFDLFRTEEGDCFHCHPFEERFLFTTNSFMNNGLDPEGAMQDSGLGAVSGNPFNIGQFKVPTLRNIALTAPYMHDGRHSDLREVMDHYNMGGHPSSTVDPLMKHVGTGLNLSTEDIDALIAFMEALTDEEFVQNPAFSAP